MKPLAIVGLDPGTATGYAIVTLDGRQVSKGASKDFPLSEVIRAVVRQCRPVLAATDKAKAPSMVREFARKTGAVIVAPRHDLQKEEKHALFGQGYKGGHDEDSLAAALFAYRRYAPRLEKITSFVERQGLQEFSEHFTRMALKEDRPFAAIAELVRQAAVEIKVIKEVQGEAAKAALQDRGERLNLWEAERTATKLNRSELKKRGLNESIKGNMAELNAGNMGNAGGIPGAVLSKAGKINENAKGSEFKEAELLRRHVRILRRRLKMLQRENQALHRRSRDFHHRLDTLVRFKEERLRLQQRELAQQLEVIASLQEKIHSLYRFIEKLPQYRLVKKLENLGMKEFLAKNLVLGITDNDVIFVAEPSIYSSRVLEMLLGRGIVIISPRMPEMLTKKFHTALVQPQEFAAQNDYFALADGRMLVQNLAGKITREDLIEKVVSEYKESRRQE